MAQLCIYSNGKTIRHSLSENCSIGRSGANSVTLDDRMVSARHCRISLTPAGSYVLTDLGSRNGTRVNGERVRHRKRLFHGDEITIASTRCVFEDERGSAVHMVEVRGEKPEGTIETRLAPQTQDRFLPEYEITDTAALRADYEKLRVTYELQRDIGLEMDIDEVLTRILDRTFELLHYDQGVVLLVDEQGELRPRAFKAAREGGRFVVSRTLLGLVRDEKAGFISTDAAADERLKDARSLITQGIRSTMAVPILSKERLLGAMIVASAAHTHAFTEKDLQLITTIANHTAQLVRNSLLHEELRLSFHSSIRTLAAMVDARHPLTAGHSLRVTEYSLLIGKTLGLDKGELEVLRFAALLHDMGKIGIPDKVLLKDGPFTAEERLQMNTHPLKTRSILESFRFPVSLRRVPHVAALHHEKLNGTGYPEGLTGDDLPRLSRIMAVADVFDALTSPRDYPKYDGEEGLGREPMPLEKVVSIIQSGSGGHFDPEVVAAFMRCLPRILRTHRGEHFDPEYVDGMLAETTEEDTGSDGNLSGPD